MPVFLSSLKKSGHLDQTHLTVCNVGSRKLGAENDYASLGWNIFAPNLTIYGFDADADACNAANADIENRQVNWTEQHIPLAIGDTNREATLYVAQDPMCSSLYPPNEPFLSRFNGLPDVMNLDFTVEVELTTLDDFCQQAEIGEIDFLQVDVQGADLQVLEGAATLLKDKILAIQIEVEFSPLYLNQPLFADVDNYLRARNFALFNLEAGYGSRARSPIVSKTNPGQILWGDAFYFYDLLQPSETVRVKTPEQLFKLACIADVMEFSDYALELLEYLTLNYGSNPNFNFADNIVEGLSAFPDLMHNLNALPVIANIRSYISPGMI
ncbi:FkbM family methyltransferase [Oculatella sp. LEGE 06141]|uniref:FkbM family methyltransferase n=1 Tax=Oculatella sp. LEGE 06141 TaxID=1828648 RepID=UPI00187E62E5|nr:FkbM family methyltransferase [Oculatella sp. LEGE 06141]MBE9177203.1 FkbM family methyltransferase [Oculatella sp. LEGE 06141]